MSKMSLAWHQECLKNCRASLVRKNAELARVREEVRRMEEDVDFLQHQIDQAVAQGKDGFDEDRFCVKRGSAR
jgi:predicted  nucleic acid-binding Zn-ribbon protein